jgi:hypothetical protein
MVNEPLNFFVVGGTPLFFLSSEVFTSTSSLPFPTVLLGGLGLLAPETSGPELLTSDLLVTAAASGS